MQVAPPEDGFRPFERAWPPMVPQNGPQLGVDGALDPVVHRRHRAFGRQARAKVREQDAFVHQARQPRPRLADSPMRVDPASVDDRRLPEEVRPELAPLHVPFDPPIGLMEGLDMQQFLRQRVQLLPRLQLRPRCRLPPYLAKRVESAPLNLSLRPLLRRRRGEPGAAVRDHRVRRRDARERRSPSRGRLGAGEVPRQDVRLRARDEDDQVAGDPDAVDEHHAMNLVDDLGHGPDPPEPRRLAPGGPALTRHIELGVLRQQPSDEGSEVPGGGVVGVGRARPARTAAPALRAGSRAPVSLHFASASRAFLVIHGDLRKSVTFYRDFPGMTCIFTNRQTRFLSERKSRFI